MISISNNAISVLIGSIAAGDTTLSVTTGTGALFPSAGGSTYFYLCLQDINANLEIVKVTARVGDAMTIARAQEGTTALAFAAGTAIELRMTAQTFYDYIQSQLTNPAMDLFTGDGVTTAFTLINITNGTTSNAIVEVGGVIQIPTTDYSISGTALTFVAAPPNATAIVCIGAGTRGVGSVTGDMLTNPLNLPGSLNFTGTGNRITGDFSNGTIANRVAFQSSTVNATTRLTSVPNGTATNSGVELYSTSTGLNASLVTVVNNGTEARFTSEITGTGTYLPMTFYTGGSERMRIDASGNVGVGATPMSVFDGGAALRSLVVAKSDSSTTTFSSQANITIVNLDTTANNSASLNFAAITGASPNAFATACISTIFGARTNATYQAGGILTFATCPTTYNVGPQERMRIDASGNVGIGVTPIGTWKVQVNGAVAGTNGTASSPTFTSINESNAGMLFGDDAVKSYVSLAGGGTEIFRVGGGSSNALVVGPGGLGYGTGSGGTVTQATSKSTAVTLNKTNGQIVMNNAALAANTAVSFQFNNSTIAATDVVVVSANFAADANRYQAWIGYTTAGSCYINILNKNVASQSDACVINFAVIKATTS